MRAQVIQPHRPAGPLIILDPRTEVTRHGRSRAATRVSHAQTGAVEQRSRRKLAHSALVQGRQQAVDLPDTDLDHGLVISSQVVGHVMMPLVLLELQLTFLPISNNSIFSTKWSAGAEP